MFLVWRASGEGKDTWFVKNVIADITFHTKRY